MAKVPAGRDAVSARTEQSVKPAAGSCAIGATVLRGHIGFGHSSRVHGTRFMRLSQDLPVVVEIVDSQEKIDRFLPVLDGMMSSGLITMERAEVLQYGTEEARPFQVVEQGLKPLT